MLVAGRGRRPRYRCSRTSPAEGSQDLPQPVSPTRRHDVPVRPPCHHIPRGSLTPDEGRKHDKRVLWKPCGAGVTRELRLTAIEQLFGHLVNGLQALEADFPGGPRLTLNAVSSREPRTGLSSRHPRQGCAMLE